jgi:hypothetical protein
LEHLHGAIHDGNFETSAFPLRTAQIGVLVAARWRQPRDDARAIQWAREAFTTLDPRGVGGAYVNYAGRDDGRAVATYPRAVADRLSLVKKKYDPRNLFARNHNIAPVDYSAADKSAL